MPYSTPSARRHPHPRSVEPEIESHAADIEAKATAANCEIWSVMLQQDVAFTAVAMPYGRAILA